MYGKIILRKTRILYGGPCPPTCPRLAHRLFASLRKTAHVPPSTTVLLRGLALQ